MALQAQAVLYDQIRPGIYRWEVYSLAHKVELTSHAIILNERIFVFDPILLAAEAMAQLRLLGEPGAIVLTNENHERDAQHWKEAWQMDVWAAPSARITLPGVLRLPVSEGGWEGWGLHPIRGAVTGEIALRSSELSLMVFGDAVVNLPGKKPAMLPEPYVADPERLQEDLERLLDPPFEAMVMAHGMPITERASTVLSKIL